MCTSALRRYKWIALERTLGVNIYSVSNCLPSKNWAEVLRRNGQPVCFRTVRASSLRLFRSRRAPLVEHIRMWFLYANNSVVANPMSIITASDQVQYLFSHFCWTPCVIFVAGRWLWSKSWTSYILHTRNRAREKNIWYLGGANGKTLPKRVESKIEIKFTSLLVSFAMCAKRLPYLRHSHCYSASENGTH